MKKFDLRAIMTRAWKLFRKASDLPFGECLHRAWLSAGFLFSFANLTFLQWFPASHSLFSFMKIAAITENDGR